MVRRDLPGNVPLDGFRIIMLEADQPSDACCVLPSIKAAASEKLVFRVRDELVSRNVMC